MTTVTRYKSKNTDLSTIFNGGSKWDIVTNYKQSGTDIGNLLSAKTFSDDTVNLTPCGYKANIITYNTGTNWRDGFISYASSVSISSDGISAVMCVYGGKIYYSQSYGGSMTASNSLSKNWNSVSIDGSGTNAIAGADYIWYSDNGGISWWQSSPSILGNWFVSISASGTFAVACSKNGFIYFSSNNGRNWSQSPGSTSQKWSSISMSASGQYAVACVGDAASTGKIYYSYTYGHDWFQSVIFPNDTTSSFNWNSISMSSSGQYAVACYTVGTTVNGYIYSSSDYGKTWTIYSNASQALTLPWSCVSISGTGQYAIAGTSNNFGRIYCSSDYGRTWTNNNTTLLKSWKCVSISASGKHAIAGNNSDQCYLSTNNSTTTITKDLTDVFDPLWKYNTWTASNSVVPTKSSITVLDQFWSSLKMSLNGNFAIGCIYNGFIYYSQDYGMTWAKSNAPSAFWTSVSMSATGQYAIACSQQSNNKIYYSSNYGVTWAVSNSTSSATSGTGWQCVSMSATGKYAVGSLWNGTVGTVYYSSDYGVNWTQSTTTETGKWISIAMSATGQIVFGCIDKQLGQVYFSSNYGASFSVRTDSPEGYWSDIAISASGQYVIGFNGGYWFIVYSTDYGQTWNGKAYSFNLIVNSLTMSATGQYALATSMSTPGYVYYSTDFGITWNNTNFPGVYVQSVAISGLGNAAIFSPTYGNIYYCSPNNL